MRHKVNDLHRQAVEKELARRKQARQTRVFSRDPVALKPQDVDFFTTRNHARGAQFVFDDSKRQALLCPRRTGKTFSAMFKVLRQAKRFPRSDLAYIVPSSQDHAKRLFWNPLSQLNTDLKLGLDFKVAEKRVITPEGSSIYLFGAKTKNSPAILRGGAWSMAILDECKDFGAHFEHLIIEAVGPALEDYGGPLVLIGTPGDYMSGQFYRITHDREHPPTGWSVHHWIKSDNTFFSPEQRDLDLIEKNEYLPWGHTRASPKFRREQLAEWCADDDERVYMYDDKRNAWPETVDERGERGLHLPVNHEWMYTLAWDLGERDANAVVVWAFSLTCRDIYLVHEFSRHRMSIDELAAYTYQLIAQFGPFTEMAADTGGYGRGIVTDMQLRHNLAFQIADKRGNKLGNIAQMNADFLSGRIKCDTSGPCAKEWMRLVRRIRPADQKVLITHSDLGDAALYAWKASKHYAAQEKEDGPEVGTRAFYEQAEARAAQKAVERRNARADSENAWLHDCPSRHFEGDYGSV